MTVKFVGNKRNLSEETRLAKNKAISEAQRATRLKRKNQICKVRDIKIVDNKLSALQREQVLTGINPLQQYPLNYLITLLKSAITKRWVLK